MAKGTVHLEPKILKAIKHLDAENNLGIAKNVNNLLNEKLEENKKARKQSRPDIVGISEEEELLND